jgi:hypothetical protein
MYDVHESCTRWARYPYVFDLRVSCAHVSMTHVFLVKTFTRKTCVLQTCHQAVSPAIPKGWHSKIALSVKDIEAGDCIDM